MLVDTQQQQQQQAVSGQSRDCAYSTAAAAVQSIDCVYSGQSRDCDYSAAAAAVCQSRDCVHPGVNFDIATLCVVDHGPTLLGFGAQVHSGPMGVGMPAALGRKARNVLNQS